MKVLFGFLSLSSSLLLANDPFYDELISEMKAENPQTLVNNNSNSSDLAQKYNSIIELGGNYTHASIRIKGQPLYHGNLGGAQVSYEWKPWNNFYAALSSTWAQGQTSNSLGTRFLTYVDAHERVGYTYACPSNKWVASFFTGFGYRHYGHRLKQSGDTLKFNYNELYVPVGIKSTYNFNSWFTGGLNFTWMPQVNSTVKIVPLNGARWIIDNKINNFRAELPLTFFFTSSKRYSVCVNPFYEYWEDGASTASVPQGLKLDLPGNVYNFWGAQVNFGFSF